MVDANCPHCGKRLGSELVAKLTSLSRMTLELTPQPGEYLGTKTVGGSIETIGKFLESVGKDLGIKTHVAVENISCNQGAILVDLLVTRIKADVEAPTGTIG